MSYAWLIVAECARGNTAEAERQMSRLADILPGFGPAMLERLFDFFPDPLRSWHIRGAVDYLSWPGT